MAHHHSPKIVTDGLKCLVDMANPKSMPFRTHNTQVTTGITLYDISGNDADWNIYTTTTGKFLNDYGGVFDFGTTGQTSNEINSADGYASVSNGLTTFTLDIWASRDQGNPTIDTLYEGGSSNQSLLLYRNNGTPPAWEFYTNGGAQGIFPNSDYTSDLNLTDGTFFNIVIRLDTGANVARLYINGEYVSSSGVTGTYTLYGNTTYTNLGQEYDGASKDPNQGWKGKFASLKLYNRALTDDEIRQNYNAIRFRFGI